MKFYFSSLYRQIQYSFLIGFILIAFGNAQEYWVHDMGGSYADETTDVVTDANGNSYIIGNFSPSYGGSFYSMDIAETTLTSNNVKGDCFFAKYDESGNLLWANSINSINNGGGTNEEGSRCLGIDIDEYAIDHFIVKFLGPTQSPYESGLFYCNLYITPEYPM